MTRFAVAGVLSVVALAPLSAVDGEKVRFAFAAGQSFSYRVLQTTTVTETTLDEQTKAAVLTTTVTKLNSTKTWTVKDAPAAGGATLEMTITAMKQEVTQTVGDKKPVAQVLDSANPDDAKVMTFLNKPVVSVTLDAFGAVTGAKSDNPHAADRLKVELPFRVTLPEALPAVNGTWERAFELKLPPPLGTGEKFDATQKYTYRGAKDGFAVVGVSTALKEPPTDAALMPGIVPMLWEGDVFVNVKTGRYHGAKLKVTKDIANHQGEGTKFVYQSEYTEAAEK
jgi:hypothetical protein